MHLKYRLQNRILCIQRWVNLRCRVAHGLTTRVSYIHGHYYIICSTHNHYLKQWCFIVKWILKNKFQSICYNWDAKRFPHYWPFVRGMHRWCPQQRDSNAKLRRHKFSRKQWVAGEVERLISTPMWCHSKDPFSIYTTQSAHSFNNSHHLPREYLSHIGLLCKSTSDKVGGRMLHYPRGITESPFK